MTGRWWLALAFALLPVLPAHATEDEKLFGAEATIPNTRVLRFTSAINGEPFTLEVRKPFGPPPKEGYSVLYVLDGELYFSIAQFLSYALPGTSPVVVGIGHDALRNKDVMMRYAKPTPKDVSKLGSDEAFNAFSHFRFMDFTTRVSPANRGPVWLGGGGNYYGGDVDKFLRVIETEIKPKVAAILPINPADQALYGHSLGGLAVIHALFTEPSAFHAFIASSPALWWNGDEVLKGEAAFEDKVRSGAVSPRVLITTAAEEPEIAISTGPLPPQRAAEIAPYLKMVGGWAGMKTGSRALADRLGKISGKTGYKVSYELIPDVDHGSEPRVGLIHAMDFAFPR